MKDKFVISVKANPHPTTHTLLVGDCLNRANEIPKNSVDLIITDPPYNIGLDYGDFKDRMKEENYLKYVVERLEKSAELLKETGSIYIITYPEIAAQLFLALKNKLKFRRWITWHYPTNIGHSKKNFTRSQRTILFFSKNNKYTFNRQKALRPYKNPTDRRVRELIKNGSKGRMMYDTIFNEDLSDILKFDISKNVSKERQKGHPCQLPSSLLKLLMLVSSNKHDTVFDPFAGTFTTSAVAAKLNRNFVGIDLERKYIDIGLKRLKEINKLNFNC